MAVKVDYEEEPGALRPTTSDPDEGDGTFVPPAL
jgi:hypothetical protein